MKCSNCGFEFSNASVCPACGSPAPAEPMPPPPPPQPQYGAPQYGAPPYGAPQYGAPAYPPPGYTQPTVVIQNTAPQEIMSDKSRNVFALLGFFLGWLGIHDFYIGKVGNGIATILANFLCSPALVQFFVGIELMTTHRDSDGARLQDDNSPLAGILGFLMIFGWIIVFGIIFMAIILPALN